MATRICYLYRQGMDIYELGKGGFFKINSPDTMCTGKMGEADKSHTDSQRKQHIKKAPKGKKQSPKNKWQMLFNKNVLLIGKDLTFYTRQKYPPTSDKNLKGIVENDLEDLFPMVRSPVFHYKIYEKGLDSYTLDIWAYDRSVLSRVRGLFNYNYLVCEELLYESPEVELSCFRGGDLYHIVAHGAKGFLTSKMWQAPPDEDQLKLFMHSTHSFRHQIRRVNVFGGFTVSGFSKNALLPEEAEVKEHKEHHPVLAKPFKKLPLKNFKAGKPLIRLDASFALRVAIYLIIGYGIFQWHTLEHFRNTLTDLERQVRKAEGEIMHLAQKAGNNAPQTQGHEEIVKFLSERFGQRPSALYILNSLAKSLPVGSVIKKISMDGPQATIDIHSPNTLETIKIVSLMEDVQKVELIGTPMKIGRTTFGFKISVIFKENISIDNG